MYDIQCADKRYNLFQSRLIHWGLKTPRNSSEMYFHYWSQWFHENVYSNQRELNASTNNKEKLHFQPGFSTWLHVYTTQTCGWFWLLSAQNKGCIMLFRSLSHWSCVRRRQPTGIAGNWLPSTFNSFSRLQERKMNLLIDHPSLN